MPKIKIIKIVKKHCGRKVLIKCNVCSQTRWLIYYNVFTRGIGKFCSKKCSGKYLSKYCKKIKRVPPYKSGPEKTNWKGDKVGYGALHEWVRRRFIKPKKCQNCKEAPPHDLANISQEYKRDLSDWEYLCRRCHMIKDGRIILPSTK